MKRTLIPFFILLLLITVQPAEASDFNDEPAYLVVYENGKPVDVVLNDALDHPLDNATEGPKAGGKIPNTGLGPLAYAYCCY